MMKMRYSMLFAALALGASSAALANPFIAPPETADQVRGATPYSFELGATAYRETYKEFIGGSKVMKQEAEMMGVQAGVTRAFEHGGKLKLSGSFATGESDYTGSYQGGKYGDVTANNLDRYAITTDLEYKLVAPSFYDVEFGAGVGYRRLVDRLDQAGEGGYRRQNDRAYLSLSMERTFAAGNWTLTPKAKYKHVVWGQQKSDIYGGLKMKQDKGYGAELSLAISHKDAWNGLTVTPYVRTWDIKASKSVQLSPSVAAYEPRNKTKEIGINISLTF